MTKRFLITSATGDIGKGMCEDLAKTHAKKLAAGKEGYELVITARDTKKLQELTNDLTKKFNIPIKYCSCDFENPESFQDLIEYFVKTANKNGSLETEIRNPLHGIVLLPPRPLAANYFEPTTSEMAAMHKTCVDAPYQLLKKLIPALQKGDDENPSHVVYPGGISSLQPLGDNLLTNTWRTGMVGIMKTLADQYGRHNIVFNTLSFGQVITQKFLEKIDKEAAAENTTREAIMERKTANVPTGRYTKLSEAVSLISIFLKKKGIRNVTGENLGAAGGFPRKY